MSLAGVIAAFDAAVAGWVVPLRGDAMTLLMRVVTTLGGTIVVTVATVALVGWLAARRRSREAMYAAVVVGGGMLISTVLKLLLERARPAADTAVVPLPSSFSLPSGHSMAALLLAAVLVRLALAGDLRPVAKRAAVAACALYAAAVGFSRVYLGVHWPSDVVASWAIGGVWIAAVTLAMRGRGAGRP